MPKAAKTERLSVDQLLEIQSHQSFKGTIEAVEGNSEAIKLTPWLPGAGCFCDMALNIPRSSIDSITMTDEVHMCCGKSLPVVEVNFVKDATIPVEDLFGQISSTAAIAAQRRRLVERQYARELAERRAPQSIMRDAVAQGEPIRPLRI
jgi:hypothetical protein